MLGSLGALGALASGLGGLLKDNVGNILNYKSQLKTNKTSRHIAEMNNATMINLANTAHQREVKDLQEAGLNPILSAGGNGAATPTLEQPTLTAPTWDPYVATDMIRTLSEAKLNDSQAELNTKTNQKLSVDMLKEAANTKLTEAQTQYQRIQTEIARGTKGTQIKKMEQELDNMIMEHDRIIADIYNKESNSAFTQLQTHRYDEIQKTQMDKLKEETKYTKRKASGKSNSRGFGVNVLGSGININQSETF